MGDSAIDRTLVIFAERPNTAHRMTVGMRALGHVARNRSVRRLRGQQRFGRFDPLVHRALGRDQVGSRTPGCITVNNVDQQGADFGPALVERAQVTDGLGVGEFEVGFSEQVTQDRESLIDRSRSLRRASLEEPDLHAAAARADLNHVYGYRPVPRDG
jgi:hypothetical protein